MAKTVKCTRCGRENDASFAFCLDCGQPLRATAPAMPAAPTCTNCGRLLDPGFRFCGHCGKPVTPPTPAPGAGAPASAASAPPPPPPAVSAPPRHPAPLAPAGNLGPTAGLRLVAVRPDGVTGQVHPLDKAELVCGRSEGDVRIPDDGTVSPRHARFAFENGNLHVEDLGSVNGTYVRIHQPHRVAVGDEIRLGRQLLRLEPLPRPPATEEGAVRAWGAPDPGCRLRLAQLLEGGGLGEIFPLKPGENHLGREAGDLVFPGDRYVSARHARLDVAESDVVLTDLGSSNGTFVRAVGSAPLKPGDQVLVGAQLFRVEE